MTQSTQETSIRNLSQNGEISAGAAFNLLYADRVRKMSDRHKNVLVVPDQSYLVSYLEEYRWSIYDYVQMFPCSGNYFEKRFKPHVSCLALTNYVRENCVDQIATLPLVNQKANFLYSPYEAYRFMTTQVDSYLRSVKLPLSLFVKDPEAFRRDFVRDKTLFLEQRHKQNTLRNPTRPAESIASRVRPKTQWPSVIEHIPEDKRVLLGSWGDEIARLHQEQYQSPRQNIVLPTIKVCLPDLLLPKYYSYREIAMNLLCSNRSSGERFVIRDGWVRHELQDSSKVAFTPGPMLGTERNWDDYRIGATETVTVPVALKLVDEQELVHAKHWLLCEKDIYWQEGHFKADHYRRESNMAWLMQTKSE